MKLIDVTGTGYSLKYEPDPTTWTLPSCHIGLELELEGVEGGEIRNLGGPLRRRGSGINPALQPKAPWAVTSDGSLRDGGLELVSAPLFGADLTDALSSLQSMLSKDKYNITYRCGLHVHINITDLEFQQLPTFFVAHMIAEPFLFNYVGTHRKENPYCVPFSNSPEFVQKISILSKLGEERESVMNREEAYSSCLRDATGYGAKYQALNILPIFDFGTVEYRHAPATNDIEWIKIWINLIMSIKRVAQIVPLKTLLEVKTADEFLNMTFHECAYVLDCYEKERLFADGYGLAKTFAAFSSVKGHTKTLRRAARNAPWHPAFSALMRKRNDYFRSKDIDSVIEDVFNA